MKIYDRQGKEVIVDQSQNQFLEKLYSHMLGRCVLKVLTLPFVTRIGGWYMSSGLSKGRIKSFIKSQHIDMSQFVCEDYACYNDFFTRRIVEGARPIDQDKSHLISPADAKASYYKISDDLVLRIKDSYYTIGELLSDNELAREYNDGVCVILRLTVDDYHRYCYIDDGTKEKDIYIPGIFHTVNPIANDYYPIYKQNTRSYSLLHTKHFDDVIHMEVGAMMVGKICNHDLEAFSRGDEKGYFEFGGSTIVLLFKKDIVDIDEDIIKNSESFNETKVLMGEKIGCRKEVR